MQMAQNARSTAQRKGQANHPPIWEEAMGVVGLVLLLAVVGFLVYEALQPHSPPAVVVSAEEITPAPGGWLVQIRVENRGESTAAAVVVEGSLIDPAQPAGEPVEVSEVTLDYVPELSARRAGLYFEHDPADYRLELRAQGYVNP
jgi:uncharacterized protein (TIGR02588 family)